MIDETAAHLISSLAEPSRRPEAAQRLATYLGAAALVILVEDRAVDAYLPAPGFSQTLLGGASWRAFLERARQPGVFCGHVDYPAPNRSVRAVSYCAAGILLVFIDTTSDVRRIESVDVLVPLLGSTLALEHAQMVARGELRAAQEHARQAESLARALDAARAELDRTVLALGQQARELEDARARSEAATLAKDEFLAMLGHELRNPLSPILTALQLMRLKNQSSREQDVIERQVQTLMRLVDDLLDVSRITQGKVELRKERIELAEVAARAIEMSSPVLEKKRQVLDITIPTRGLAIDADPFRMAQVLANLLTNAAKYSDAATRIDLVADQHDQRVRVRVKDQGIGIPPGLLDRVFEPFVQNRQGIERSQGGLGLGLAIVRSLVALHGGTVSAFSRGEGRGSEFVVELPAAETEGLQGRALDGIGPALTHTHTGGRVLVVDDNDDAATLMSEALHALGYVVRTAPDGPTALRIADSFQPDVALLDIGLPIMDGYELARHLRQLDSMNDLHLIAVTGYGQVEDKRRSEAAGFVAHLVKPIDLEELGRVLGRLRDRDA